MSEPVFPKVELRILDFWAQDRTFEASVSGDEEFVFYDGPPFANGLPHYGHLLTGYIKDAVPRYQTMRGKRVERRFGWDCHGLPAEVDAEKQLGITGKADILQLGIGAFNAATRESVLRYAREWEQYVTRQARWVDFAGGYKTLDVDYMESVLWAFKTLHDKGLVYEGHQVLAYCWRCETPLSATETKMDDTYRDRRDPALTVAFPLETGEKALVWTTTPWTLPGNQALAVGPDLDYAVAELDGERYVVGRDAVPEGATVVEVFKGRELVGRRYVPPFDFVEGDFRILAAGFVDAGEGTGIVHLAPAFGEDDHEVCAAAGIAPVMTVDERTRFTALVPPFEGLQVFEANGPIIDDLRASGLVHRHESYVHSYPHCWRCDTPLVYKAVSSWFVAVTKVRDRMVELNKEITWVPGHIGEGQFGKWLEGARDWSISRNRFWGTPIPVWKSDDPAYPRLDVYGSVEELERDFGTQVTDLHRPYIDELTRPNPDDPTGRSTMRRVPEVLDCWFESGSMPYAQAHYPFENRKWFESHYPGDFIVEYTAQTRGWFYTLHVLATALFDRPAFRTALVHGTLLSDDGRKMSKSLSNYPDVYEMFDRYGSDAMRWMLLSSPVMRGGDMAVSEQAVRDAVRQVLMPLWSVWSFYSLYAGGRETESDHPLDRYALAKTDRLVADVTARMDTFDLSGACGLVRTFLDVLTNWYVRRSRTRFWAGDPQALGTLHSVLEVLTRVMAPLAPLVTEEIWKCLTGGRSVHLTPFPRPRRGDDDLVTAMDEVREVCSAALALRKAAGLRVRLPLPRLTVATPAFARLAPFVALIEQEVNVKEVVLTGDLGEVSEQVLTVVPRVLGPRLGPDVQRVIKAVRAGDWAADGGVVTAGGVELLPGEYELRSVAADADHSAAIPDGVLVLDVAVTPELLLEGVARDLIRAVQQARREAGFEVADRVRVRIEGGEEVAAAVAAHRDLIAAETLADEVCHVPGESVVARAER
ncbi:isoleucine--tRNA ligase [Nonomuraea mangrovi]|uniref:Isoleucine--tRNA ligase n=1 Tax=Nonomuraea mangrovi TaxID=2316207 RepID=A0ABW4T0R5_9ACTN